MSVTLLGKVATAQNGNAPGFPDLLATILELGRGVATSQVLISAERDYRRSAFHSGSHKKARER